LLEGWLGAGSSQVVHENGWSGLIASGFTVLYHGEWLELGAGITGQSRIVSWGSTVFAFLAGVKADVTDRMLRLELLGEAGGETVSGVGKDLFSSALGGDDALLPYLGVRGGLSFLLGGARRFLVGLLVNAGDAVGEEAIHPSIQSCFLGCTVESKSFTIGGPSWSMGLRLGGEPFFW